METATFSAKRFRNLLRMSCAEGRKFHFKMIVFFYLFAVAYMCWYMLPDAAHAHTVMQEAGLPGRQAEWQTLSAQIAQGIDGSWKEVKIALIFVASLFCTIYTTTASIASDKTSLIRTLTLPVSRLEILALLWIHAFPLSILGSMAIGLAADWTRVVICNLLYPDLHYAFPFLSSLGMEGSPGAWEVVSFFILMGGAQSLFIWITEFKTNSKRVCGYLLCLFSLLPLIIFSIAWKIPHIPKNLFLAIGNMAAVLCAGLAWWLIYRDLRKKDLTYVIQ